MHEESGLSNLEASQLSGDQVVLLYRQGEHEVYWIGTRQETVFRCNSYLLRDGAEQILVDPGGRTEFAQTLHRVSQICPPEQISGMVISHQDPDVAASMGEWLARKPGMRVFTHPRVHILLSHYGVADYELFPVERDGRFELPSGAFIQFVDAPFLHSPGAITTYDSGSRYLFSSDIWAAITPEWRLLVEDFTRHRTKLDLFHAEYMASNIAARGFVERIESLKIDAILPQHGEIIPGEMVPQALDYLRQLRCGTDLLYPDLTP